ncbi:MAG: exopolyphosphatase [Crocinitomicaceae bacterium]|nr:exopolyphosphatase [Crocinitomicaceae bacterium]
MRYAAIDIGSNAIRLLIKDVNASADSGFEQERIAYYRVPLRLGSDVFERGKLSKTKVKSLVKVMIAFRHLIDVQDVAKFRAVATSALRSAKNRDDVIHTILRKTDIEIECLSGEQEAELIFQNFDDAGQKFSRDLLCIDVGGGSTELSVVRDNERIAMKSFKLGAVRMLKATTPEGEWDRIEAFMREFRGEKPWLAIGTGGNINRYHRIARLEKDANLPASSIASIKLQMEDVPLEQRSRLFGLKSNRADVIIPAGEIYLKILELAETDFIWVPKVGLADGVILSLWRNHEQ